MSSVFVPGIPQQKGNIIKGKWGGYHDTNKKLRPWMQQVVTTITEAGWEPILHGPVCVDITFVFPRPKAHDGSGRNANVLKADAPLWHTKAPDRHGDPLGRAPGSMVEGAVFVARAGR